MAAGDVIWNLLRVLDDPSHLERPESFDERLAVDRFKQLEEQLGRTFGCDCSVDAWPNVQDASFFGRIVVPASATVSGGNLVAVVSNFWPLAMYALENPGAHDRSELEVLLDDHDRRRLEQGLSKVGLLVVDEGLFELAYDGACSACSIRTWGMRFFDYL